MVLCARGHGQPSVTPSPHSELSELPGTAQLVTNSQTVRSKPKGCHNCPRPQPLEPPDHLLRCWVLSARTHLSLGGTGSVPGVPHRAWQGEGRVQAAAPTDLSTLSTPSPGPTSAQALSSSVHSTRGVLSESFLAVRPAVPSARAQGHKPAAPRLLCSPSRSPRRCLGWICPGLWDRSLQSSWPCSSWRCFRLAMNQLGAMLELGIAPTLQSEELMGNSLFAKGIHSVTG